MKLKMSANESKNIETKTLSLIETISYSIQNDNVLEVFMASEFFVKFVEFFLKRIWEIF